MSLAVSILAWDHPDLAQTKQRLVDRLLDECIPTDMSVPDYFVDRIKQGLPPHPVPLLVGAVDNCTSVFPKCAHSAVMLLSLLVSQRPANLFFLLDPKPVVAMASGYLRHVSTRVMNAECIVEEKFGITELLNIIPLLYYLADWHEAVPFLERYQLAAGVASLAINIVHSCHRDPAQDCSIRESVKQFPELHKAKIPLKGLYGADCQATAAALESNPLSFTAGVFVEILARWQRLGVPCNTQLIPQSDSTGELDPCTVAESLKEYLPKWKALAEAVPALAPISSLWKALASSRTPKVGGVIRKSLQKISMRCALPSCILTRSFTDGGPLKLCSGSCQGLARYCGAVHQREHHKQHSIFCRRQDPIDEDTRNFEMQHPLLKDVLPEDRECLYRALN